MPVDANGYPTESIDPAALGRRLLQVERIAELTGGSRSLTSASIGKGGLRVIKDGDIRIEGTGSLIIQTGNLILGAGKIDGAALKSQLEPSSTSATASNIGLSTSWATKATLVLTAPAWATTTVVQAYCVGNFKNNDASSEFNWNGAMRAQVGGTTSLDVALVATNTAASGNNFRATGSISYSTSVDTRTNKSVPVNLQAKANAASTFPTNSSSRVDLYVVALFFR